jgi:hypothetical protein
MSLLIWKGPTNALVETPESGTLIASDRIRWTQVFKGIYWLCRANQPARGAFGTGVFTGWVCNQSSVTMERGQIGKLTIEWEAGGSSAMATLPIGDFSLDPQELYPRIERNQHFLPLEEDNIKIANNAALWTQRGVGTLTSDPFYVALFGAPAIAANPTTTPPTPASDAVAPSITDSTQLELAQALYKKLLRGEETFYITAWRYSYEEFSYSKPTISNGGFTGTPGGPMRDALPINVVWLRLADHPQPAGVNGSMYKNTINWLGGPIVSGVGYWDPDLYPAG